MIRKSLFEATYRLKPPRKPGSPAAGLQVPPRDGAETGCVGDGGLVPGVVEGSCAGDSGVGGTGWVMTWVSYGLFIGLLFPDESQLVVWRRSLDLQKMGPLRHSLVTLASNYDDPPSLLVHAFKQEKGEELTAEIVCGKSSVESIVRPPLLTKVLEAGVEDESMDRRDST